MKKLLILLLVMCLAPAALAQENILTDEDFAFRLTDAEDAAVYRLGDAAETLLADLAAHTGGEVLLTFEDQDCMLPGMTREYSTADGSIVLATRPLPGDADANTLETIQVLSDAYATARGARVGMTLEEIAALYGQQYTLDFDTAVYANGDLEPQIMFFFDMETWECIGWMLFRNMVI